eukprot:12304526-Karenia_brevis.AAC.1
MALKRPPTWSRGEGTFGPSFRACWVLEGLEGLLEPKRRSRLDFNRFCVKFGKILEGFWTDFSWI